MRKRKTSGTTGSGLLIVVELGADWPGLMRSDASARRVLTQHEGETPLEFADRVTSSVDGLFARGVQLGTAALACNERIDPAADAARRKLGGLILGAMAKSQAGRFFFTAPPRSSGRLRHALSALARSLFDEWRTAGLEVSVDWGDELAAAAAPPVSPSGSAASASAIPLVGARVA